jgi:hypothetical protein
MSKTTEYIIEAAVIFVSEIKKTKSPFRAGYGLVTKSVNAVRNVVLNHAGANN